MSRIVEEKNRQASRETQEGSIGNLKKARLSLLVMIRADAASS